MLMFLFKFTNSSDGSRSAGKAGIEFLRLALRCHAGSRFLALLPRAQLPCASATCVRAAVEALPWSRSASCVPSGPGLWSLTSDWTWVSLATVLYMVFICRNYMRPKVTLFPSERHSLYFCQKSWPTRCPKAGLQNSSVMLKILFI